MTLFAKFFKKNKVSQEQINRHFVFIEAPKACVVHAALLWGEGEWWPKDSVAQFQRQTNGGLQVGAQYLLMITKPLNIKFLLEVTKYDPQKFVERTFKSGMIVGCEWTKVEERSNGTRVDYELQYKIKGLFSKVLWNLFLKKMHENSIKTILACLKNHCLQTYQAQEQKKFNQG